MGANKAVARLVLERIETSLGPVSKIRLAEPLNKVPLAHQQQDPLVDLAQLSASLNALCTTIYKLAKYPAEPLHFTSNSAAS